MVLHDRQYLINMGCAHKTRQEKQTPNQSFPLLTPAIPAIKIIFCGQSSVGKTSICHRCRDDSFNKLQQATISPCYHTRNYIYQQKQLKIKLWDTAGEQRFRSVNRIFFRGADIAILVFDVTNLLSFKQMQFWFAQLSDKVNRQELVLCKKVIRQAQQAIKKISKIKEQCRLKMDKRRLHNMVVFIDKLQPQRVQEQNKCQKMLQIFIKIKGFCDLCIFVSKSHKSFYIQLQIDKFICIKLRQKV